MAVNDSELLTAYVHRRDADAFATLVERYKSFVYGTSMRRLGNSADTEDVTQEVFLSLAKHAHRVNGEKIGGWLYRTAINATISRQRQDRARTTRERAQAKPASRDDANSDWRQIEEVLDICLAELPSDARELIVERFYLDRSQQELADMLGVDQSTISRRLSAAVGQLRRRIVQRGITLSVAGLSAALTAQASAVEVPAALSASLNKIGVAGVRGREVASSQTTAWLSSGAVIATASVTAVAVVAVSTALLLKSAASRSVGPTMTVAQPASPIDATGLATVTRLDYSRSISISGLAIDSDGQVVMYVDRPPAIAGITVVNTRAQPRRFRQLPEHHHRAFLMRAGRIVVMYDQNVGVLRGNSIDLLTENAASDVLPDINERGVVAFIESEPVSRIRLSDETGIRTQLEAGDRFASFSEVCINNEGEIAFRATTTDGVDGIFVTRRNRIDTIAEVGEEFQDFRETIDFNNAGEVAFIAMQPDGSDALCLGDRRHVRRLVTCGGYFESIQRLSLNNEGQIAFIAHRPGDTDDLPIAGLYLYSGSQVVELMPQGQPMGQQRLAGCLIWRDCLNDAGQLAVLLDCGPDQRSFLMRLDTADIRLAE